MISKHIVASKRGIGARGTTTTILLNQSCSQVRRQQQQPYLIRFQSSNNKNSNNKNAIVVQPKLHPRHEYMLLQSRTSNIKSHQQAMELDEKTGKVIPKLLVKDSIQVESHKILAGNSFIKASSSGLNTVLPYGERVMEKLIRLIDGVMQQPGPMDQCANGVKVAMPCMSHKKGWEMTGRWEGKSLR